jgi:uroporphyrinogen III methyltransferase / synthase
MGALEGQRVVVTRAAGQAEDFSAKLRAEGAQVLDYPVIVIGPPESWAPVDAAIASLSVYQWIVFTSANAARIFWERAGAAATNARICAIGPATARAIAAAGRTVTLTAGDFIGEGALAALRQHDLNGQHILLPRAAVARDTLPTGLRAAGAQVDIVDVYRNTLPPAAPPFPPAVDWVTFTSASTVKNLLVLAGREVLNGVKIASIGPETSRVLRMHEINITVEASPSTTGGLLDAMLHHLPLTDVLDLHAFAPRDVQIALEAFLENAHDQGWQSLRVIHGRGIGAQRDMVRRVLAQTEFVAHFQDAPAEAGGWGATLVTLRR